MRHSSERSDNVAFCIQIDNVIRQAHNTEVKYTANVTYRLLWLGENSVRTYNLRLVFLLSVLANHRLGRLPHLIVYHFTYMLTCILQLPLAGGDLENLRGSVAFIAPFRYYEP